MHPELICMEFPSFAFVVSQCLEGNMSVLQYQLKEQLLIETIVPSVYIPPVKTSSPCCQLWIAKRILARFSFISYKYLKQIERKFSKTHRSKIQKFTAMYGAIPTREGPRP